MRNGSAKLAAAAIVGAASVMNFSSIAKADFVSTLSAPTTADGFDTYVASIRNNGLNGTGTNLLVIDSVVSVKSGGYLRIENTQDLDFDGMNDFNFGTNINAPGLAYGSNKGTFSLPTNPTFGADFENNSYDDQETWSSYDSPAFNPGLYTHLTRLEMLFAAGAPNGISATIARKYFNIVVPHGATFVMDGYVLNNTGVAFPINYIPTPPPLTVKIALSAAPTDVGGQIKNGAGGTAAAPLGTFTPLGAATSALTVVGSSGNFKPGFVFNIGPPGGVAAGYVNATGFTNFENDLDVFLLNLKVAGIDPTLEQENTLIAEINADNPQVVARLVAADLTNLGGIANPWDIEIDISGAVNLTDSTFGFNFTNETNVGNVTVTDLAAIPEPASGGLLLLSSIALATRRRRGSRAIRTR